MSYKVILVDFFGVISSEVAPCWFSERYPAEKAARLKEEYMGRSDRGDVSESETFQSLAALSGETAEEVRRDFMRRAVIDREMVSLLRELKKSYRIVLLSNAMSAWLNDILVRDGIGDLFDIKVISSELHMAKPEPPIFLHALAAAGASPEEALFTDDNPKNIEGAKAVGIHAVLFTGADSLRAALRS